MKFYKDEANGAVYTAVSGTEVAPQGLKELAAGVVDAAQEKHVPVIERDGNHVSVKVGSVAHPMLPEHYIEWIVLETTLGSQTRQLNPGDKPEAMFVLADGEDVKAAYELCNLHGLWEKKG